MRIYELNFRGAKLIGVIHKGEISIPVRPIADAIGIEWNGQYEAIKRHPVLSKGVRMIRIPFGNGGPQTMMCLPLHRLHFWLARIESGRIKNDDVRTEVVAFQEECADALFAHFMPEFAATLGIDTPTIDVRLLSEDLFDREPPRLEAPVLTQIAPIPALDQDWARRIDVQEIKDALGQQLARVFVELYQVIVDHSSISRRGAPPENVEIYDQVIIECFDGCCPITWPERVKIIDQNRNHILGVYEIDHITGNKSKNGLYEMMPMREYWNKRLEKKGSRERWSPEIRRKMETFFGYVQYYTGQPSLLFHQQAAE